MMQLWWMLGPHRTASEDQTSKPSGKAGAAQCWEIPNPAHLAHTVTSGVMTGRCLLSCSHTGGGDSHPPCSIPELTLGSS